MASVDRFCQTVAISSTINSSTINPTINTTMKKKQVCIIGCGSSGMPVVKAMRDRGVSFDCFEASDEIGGNWVLNNSNGISAAYESLRINTSREAMQYADYPMPDSYPVYPNHHQIRQYFNDYFAEFDLAPHVQFNTTVTSCEQLANGSWQLEVSKEQPGEPSKEESFQYEELIVANGHHWDPRWPEPAFPGEFDGLVMHSHSYVSPSQPIDFSNKKIIVLGLGNSAVDIACELSQPALNNKVHLSVRTSAWVLPRFMFGQAIGRKTRHYPHWRLLSAFGENMLRLSHGTPQSHGLPKPKHRLAQAHPTISQYLYGKLDDGEIIPERNIEELKGARVRFEGGREIDADIIIYATGYKVSFPFFAPDFLSATNNELALWQHMLKPELENLYFVGLCQPLGAIMPLAEQQGKLIADAITGKLKFPAIAEMQEDIQKETVARNKRYLSSSRHTMQVDGPAYRKALDKVRVDAEARAAEKAPRLNVG